MSLQIAEQLAPLQNLERVLLAKSHGGERASDWRAKGYLVRFNDDSASVVRNNQALNVTTQLEPSRLRARLRICSVSCGGVRGGAAALDAEHCGDRQERGCRLHLGAVW